MIDPTQNQNSGGFVGDNDKSGGASFQKDERFITAPAEKPGEWDLTAGDNFIFVLPSSADFADYFPTRKQDYRIGIPYNRVTVRTDGQKRPRNYRVSGKDNPLSKAFWRLYESLAKTPLWDDIKAGFQAGGDNRRILQVVVMKAGGKMSPVKMWSVTDDRANPKPGQQLSMYGMVRNALNSVYQFYKAQGEMFPFFPKNAALLKVSVAFQGQIPRFNVIEPFMHELKPYLGDVSAQWDACDKNMAQEWCAGTDELPDITKCDTIMRSPQACQILGLQTSVAPQAPAGVQMQAAPVQPQQMFVPQNSAPVGFGAPPAPPVAPVVPQAAPVVPPVAPAAAPVLPVNAAPGGQAAGEAFAASLQAELEKRKAAGGPPF